MYRYPIELSLDGFSSLASPYSFNYNKDGYLKAVTTGGQFYTDSRAERERFTRILLLLELHGDIKKEHWEKIDQTQERIFINDTSYR